MIILIHLDTMRPICLPLLGDEEADLDGYEMVATGWGKTHDGSIIFIRLLCLRVLIEKTSEYVKLFFCVDFRF